VPDGAAGTIALSLVSHTNVGKTTLARTLLARDVGEVRDEAHVTLEAERFLLIETPSGDRLELWDTPGLGDSVRLARRLAQAGSPIGWFLDQVWDRFRDRAPWSSQRAVRNVLEHADVVLYLVNAAEAPQDVAYLDAELKVLALLGKPVVALLNQMGPPRPAAQESAEVDRWRQRMAQAGSVRAVLAFDAFARCWVQEDTLLAAVADALPASHRAAFERLRAAWLRRNRERWNEATGVLAESLARAALDREVVHDEGWTGRLKSIGAALGLRREGSLAPREFAMQALAERVDDDVRATTDRLIALHGLDGKAGGIVLARLAEHYAVREPVSEGKAALLGGVVTGALAGLKADLATGGLSMGAGLLAGGVLGALGAAGLARGYNLVRGVGAPTLAWSDGVLSELARAALLRYLAVAHYGRGRGQWRESESPAHWAGAVDAVMAQAGPELEAVWARRDAWREAAPVASGAAADATPPGRKSRQMVAALQTWLHNASAELLLRLYPGAVPGGRQPGAAAQ
jgi:hypothetical protein